MAADRTPDKERVTGTTDRTPDDLVWKNPPETARRTPGSHSTGGRKDQTLPGENQP